MMCSLQQGVSSIGQGALEIAIRGPQEPGEHLESTIERAIHQMGYPKFVEYLLVATVAEFIEGRFMDELVKNINTALVLPGVLASNVGRCEPFLGEHSFMIHVRAVDTESCDAAYRSAERAYKNHLSQHNMELEEDFADIIVVDFESEVIGAHEVSWPAIRISIFRYKEDVAEKKKKDLIQVLYVLPTLFPLVKQVSWGRNIAREKTQRNNYRYADVDHELGVILGFSCCQDMYDLEADPKYWELVNSHGIALLEKYQVFTFCSP